MKNRRECGCTEEDVLAFVAGDLAFGDTTFVAASARGLVRLRWGVEDPEPAAEEDDDFDPFSSEDDDLFDEDRDAGQSGTGTD